MQEIDLHRLELANDLKVIFLCRREKAKLPEDENYCDMVNLMCCPVLKLVSFTTFMLVSYLGIFIAECVLGLNREGALL